MNIGYKMVRLGSKSHSAWSDFYRGHGIYKFIPDGMAVFADWPPTNHLDLEIFANRLQNLRVGWDKSEASDADKYEIHSMPDGLCPYPHLRPYSPWEKERETS